ncbi:MAG TPA: transcriptional regulator [Actinomycetota bacterium]|nr:transcriptional regulator [Actinomycetota bacterium]
MDEDRFERGVAALQSLHDPVRRGLYRFVAAQSHDVGRDEAARAVGVQRGLAGFHLDKLVEAGLLEVAAVRRVSGRSGPGAGRPAKLYRRAAVQHEVSVPERTYDLAALLLAEAVDEAGVEPALHAAARRLGVRAGRQERQGARPLAEVLAGRGYEPYRDGASLRLGNCPFRDVAGQLPAVVCGMNLALLEGLLDGLGAEGTAAVMDPEPGRCCVALISK